MLRALWLRLGDDVKNVVTLKLRGFLTQGTRGVLCHVSRFVYITHHHDFTFCTQFLFCSMRQPGPIREIIKSRRKTQKAHEQLSYSKIQLLSPPDCGLSDCTCPKPLDRGLRADWRRLSFVNCLLLLLLLLFPRTYQCQVNYSYAILGHSHIHFLL